MKENLEVYEVGDGQEKKIKVLVLKGITGKSYMFVS